MSDDRSTRIRRSIRKQAFLGLGICLRGIALMALPLAALGQAEIDKDPTPMLPGIAAACIGGLLLFVARVRQMFFMPRKVAGDMAKEGAKRILESVLG